MNQLSNSSTYNEIFSLLNSFQFQEFSFGIQSDDPNHPIIFTNFCLSFLDKMLVEIPKMLMLPTREVSITNKSLSSKKDISSYLFRVAILDPFNPSAYLKTKKSARSS